MKDIKEYEEKVLLSLENLKQDLMDFMALRKANQKALEIELRIEESGEKDGKHS